MRHYGQDASGRKTTVNYFSTRATAGAAAPSGRQPTLSGALTSARDAGSGRPTTGEAVSIDVTDSLRDDAFSLAEASTTTVKTVISGPGNAPNQLAADDQAAAIVNAFEGVELDAEAQAQIYRTLEACAERRRALEDDPENNPERFFIGEAETNGYLGELETGTGDDWVEYRSGACPEQGRRGEYSWESLGEGGQAAEIDKVLAEMAERRAAMSPEQIAAEKAEAAAAVRAEIAKQQRLPAPVLRLSRAQSRGEVEGPEPDPDSLPRTGSGDPRLDWRNWSDGGYVAPALDPPLLLQGRGTAEAAVEGHSSAAKPVLSDAAGGVEGAGEPISPRRDHQPLKPYKKRTPKPPFTPPKPVPAKAGEARKAEAVAAVAAERREGATAEAERRRRRESDRPKPPLK